MIASAIKVNVATVMPSENVTKLELSPSVNHIKVVVFLACSAGVFWVGETLFVFVIYCSRHL